MHYNCHEVCVDLDRIYQSLSICAGIYVTLPNRFPILSLPGTGVVEETSVFFENLIFLSCKSAHTQGGVTASKATARRLSICHKPVADVTNSPVIIV